MQGDTRPWSRSDSCSGSSSSTERSESVRSDWNRRRMPQTVHTLFAEKGTCAWQEACGLASADKRSGRAQRSSSPGGIDWSWSARHVLDRLLLRLCSQKPPPPHSFARASHAVVLADARPSALLALAPFPIVLADARPSALLALAPLPSMLADAGPSAPFPSAPLPIVLADNRPSALPTCSELSSRAVCSLPLPPPSASLC